MLNYGWMHGLTRRACFGLGFEFGVALLLCLLKACTFTGKDTTSTKLVSENETWSIDHCENVLSTAKRQEIQRAYKNDFSPGQLVLLTEQYETEAQCASEIRTHFAGVKTAKASFSMQAQSTTPAPIIQWKLSSAYRELVTELSAPCTKLLETYHCETIEMIRSFPGDFSRSVIFRLSLERYFGYFDWHYDPFILASTRTLSGISTLYSKYADEKECRSRGNISLWEQTPPDTTLFIKGKPSVWNKLCHTPPPRSLAELCVIEPLRLVAVHQM